MVGGRAGESSGGGGATVTIVEGGSTGDEPSFEGATVRKRLSAEKRSLRTSTQVLQGQLIAPLQELVGRAFSLISVSAAVRLRVRSLIALRISVGTMGHLSVSDGRPEGR